MHWQILTNIFFQIFGGLGIFLLGMNFLKDGLQIVAGNTFRKLVNSFTSNRVVGVGIGALITMIIQSSTVTTVMAVGLVNSGIMSLMQAMGVIIGANIGTTVTAWFLVLNLGKYGLPLVGFASMLYLFSKKDRFKYIGLTLMGIGMIFFGLELMKEGFRPMRELPEFLRWFQLVSAHSYLGVFVAMTIGCILTFLMHSSAATVGIAMGLASTGILDFPTATAIVLGNKVGTTFTALLASVNTTADAKRTAYWHTTFNFLGTFWVFLFFFQFVPLLEYLTQLLFGGAPHTAVYVNGVATYPFIQWSIALVHTVSSVTNALLFLPILSIFHTLLKKWVKEDPLNGPKSYINHANFDPAENPGLALELTSLEIDRLKKDVYTMLISLESFMGSEKAPKPLKYHLIEEEKRIDEMKRNLLQYLSKTMSDGLSKKMATECQVQIRRISEYEFISDAVVSILKIHLFLGTREMDLDPLQRMNLFDIHQEIVAFFDWVHDEKQQKQKDFSKRAQEKSDSLNHELQVFREIHWEKMLNHTISLEVSNSFMDISNNYQRIKNHLVNIARALELSPKKNRKN